jgi:hypothetical protein
MPVQVACTAIVWHATVASQATARNTPCDLVIRPEQTQKGSSQSCVALLTRCPRSKNHQFSSFSLQSGAPGVPGKRAVLPSGGRRPLRRARTVRSACFAFLLSFSSVDRLVSYSYIHRATERPRHAHRGRQHVDGALCVADDSLFIMTCSDHGPSREEASPVLLPPPAPPTGRSLWSPAALALGPPPGAVGATLNLERLVKLVSQASDAGDSPVDYW